MKIMNLAIAATAAAMLAPMPALAQIGGVNPPSRQADDQADNALDRQPGVEQRRSNYRGEAGQQQRPQGGMQQAGTDQELVNYLAAKMNLCNASQVALGEMAAQQAENQQVKDFAQQVQQSYQQLNQQLKQAMPGVKTVDASFASDQSSRSMRQDNRSQVQNRDRVDLGIQTPGQDANPLAENALGQNSPARNNQMRDQQQNRDAQNLGLAGQQAARAGQSAPRGDFLDGAAQKLMDITRRAAEENHQATVQMLREKQGKEFDKCFVAAQVGTLTWYHSELTAIRDTGPQQFSQVVQEAERKVADHLEKAKQLAQQLSDSQSSNQRAIN
ncbi:DUF4142 domain-containing protein [Botrimarina sp.]|uniref:DUF4142 domain-containing protein n=1 Tax=Botrimarina sp. TaxID=2795802 RepID=UPI0032ED5FA0